MPPGDSRGNLSARIEAEIRERLEEALDAACLDALVRLRVARQEPAPRADSAQDRAEYHAGVRRLLERLDARLGGSAAEAGSAGDQRDPVARLMASQIALARTLPDYWQRFDAVRLEWAAERASGGEGRGFLRRLFGLR